MTLRDKIAETISIKFDHQVEPDDYVDEIADALLNLPELKEKLEKADKWDAWVRDVQKAELKRIKEHVNVYARVSMVQKWKENSDKWEAMNGTETQAASVLRLKERV